MEREHKPFIPKVAKFPLFILGLAIMILGGLGGNAMNLSASTEATVVGIGFLVLIVSIILG